MRWLLAIGELGLLCWFVSIGFEAVVQRAAGMRSPFRLGEFHHAFGAAGLVLLGWALDSVTGHFVQLLGIVMTADDLWQHLQQTLNGYVEYRSPLHRLFARYLWPLPWVPPLTRFLDRWWLAGVVLGLLALWLLGCAPASPVRLVPRPDTRRISGVLIDSATHRRTLTILRAAYPSEAAVCFSGALRDSIIDGQRRRLVAVEHVRPAIADSADKFNVWFPRGLIGGCLPGAIGVGHSHTHAPFPSPCSHSPNDADLLFQDVGLLFSLIFCADGRAELLYQDGRRYPDTWLRGVAAP